MSGKNMMKENSREGKVHNLLVEKHTLLYIILITKIEKKSL